MIASGKCCADSDGGGKCCNDGSCATSSQTCCLYGDRCENDTKCCQGGCAPLNTECCGEGHHCSAGEYCCGNNVCAPVGGECCIGGGICDAGTVCMLYNGYKTCCEDTSCSEYETESSGTVESDSGTVDSDSEEAPPSADIPSISIPDISISSFNPADYTSLADPTIPPIPDIGAAAGGATAITSFTFATITAQSTVGAVLETFTTTITIYYYTLFITTTIFIRTESSFITSDFTSAEQEVTAVAADSADAEDVFRSLRRSIQNAPTPTISGDGVADFSQTRELAESETASGRFIDTEAGANEGGFTSAGSRVGISWEWGVGIVGIGTLVAMILL
ncbi:MAG: hypothetical protein Q9169_003943 [Polycauliona sp. 2 TL-2023]